MLNKNDSLAPEMNLNATLALGDARVEGVDLDELPIGTVLEIKTEHHSYRLENLGNGSAVISGHPKYCPEPLTVQIHGSFATNCALKWHFVGAGMKLAFLPPHHGLIGTSRIDGIRILRPRPQGSN